MRPSVAWESKVLDIAANPFTPWSRNLHLNLFIIVFLFRYIRVIVNWTGYLLYRPVPMARIPPFASSDITVVIPTTRLDTAIFHEQVTSILAHPIALLIVATGGQKALEETPTFKAFFPDRRIRILHRATPSRRHQTAATMALVTTPLLIISDDHTFWPPHQCFLPSLISPFTAPRTGAVAPVLCAKHHQHALLSWRGFWNFIGMTYLLRRAHEFLATNTLDGGISCLSARFAVFRSCTYTSPAFLSAYLDESISFLGQRVGPLDVDDDKFHTRWLALHGWGIKIQGGPESTMQTELGVWPKFAGQVLRWNRTTWRSNPRALFTEQATWRRFPYTTYAVLMYSFVRMTLFYEAFLLWLLKRALDGSDQGELFGVMAAMLAVWVTGWRFAKVWPHFRAHPRELVYFPGYVVFAYVCSFVKVFAAVTCWNTFWETEADIKEGGEGDDVWGAECLPRIVIEVNR